MDMAGLLEMCAMSLIETLWNVNRERRKIYVRKRSLIETLWNVNTTFRHISPSRDSFNRNIVECKFELFCNFFRFRICLIETLWNVNIIQKCANSAEPGLIETLWNVN